MPPRPAPLHELVAESDRIDASAKQEVEDALASVLHSVQQAASKRIDIRKLITDLVSSLADLRWFPRWALDLIGAGQAPGVPLVGLASVADTLLRLVGRGKSAAPARNGLSNRYTIGDVVATGFEFVYGKTGVGAASPHAHALNRLEALGATGAKSEALQAARELKLVAEQLEGPAPRALGALAADDLTTLSLTEAGQWEMGWTRYAGIYERATREGLGERFAAALDPSEPAAASAAFWPTLARYSLPYNLLILEKVTEERLQDLKAVFGKTWDEAWDGDDLYQIDLRLFERAETDHVNGRFTPSTVTVLRRTAAGGDWGLTPIAVHVSFGPGSSPQAYVERDAAWVWALQAARTSATVYGIWVGHVYHWHVVSAAAFQALEPAIADSTHPVRQLLDPQAQWLREFDEALFLTWRSAAPPTSYGTVPGFLRLMSDFAAGRSFFDDDPKQTLARNGIERAAFSNASDWDGYPTVEAYLYVWDAAERYVTAVVDACYASDEAVAGDAAVQAWLKEAGASDAGNLKGLSGSAQTKEGLAAVLTSLIYRVTVHGTGRLLDSANPGLTFVANFPPCLQSSKIPAPDTEMSAADLFAWQPKTGTIGEMLNFYNVFSFSEPYAPLIPFDGVEQLRFEGAHAVPCNAALADFRRAIERLVDETPHSPAPGLPQRYQWPLSIET